MKQAFRILFAAALALVACGEDVGTPTSGAGGDNTSSSDSQTSNGTGGNSATSAAGGAGGGTSSNAGSGGSAPLLPYCVESCSSPSDCAMGTTPLYDVSHYTCDSNRCVWQGCKANSECAEVFAPDYVCGNLPGVPFPTCVKGCTTPSDCAVPGVTLYDASHYACQDNHCEWLGCQKTSDCTEAFSNSDYVCESPFGYGQASCYQTCSAAAECAAAGPGLYDASHYACTNSRCQWLGCQADNDCQAAFMNLDFVCAD